MQADDVSNGTLLGQALDAGVKKNARQGLPPAGLVYDVHRAGEVTAVGLGGRAVQRHHAKHVHLLVSYL